MVDRTNIVRRAPLAGAETLLETHHPRPPVAVVRVHALDVPDQPRLVSVDRTLTGRVHRLLTRIPRRQPENRSAPREHVVHGLSEVLQVARLELLHPRVRARQGLDLRDVALPHRDRVAVTVHEVILRHAADEPRRERVPLRADLHVRHQPRDAVRQADHVSHLRHASPTAGAATVQEHDNRDATELVIVAGAGDLPPAIEHERHRRIGRVERRPSLQRRRVGVHPQHVTKAAPQRVDFIAHLQRRLNRDDRVCPVVRVRPDSHERAPVDLLIRLHQRRLGRQVVVLPRLTQRRVLARRVPRAVERAQRLPPLRLHYCDPRHVDHGLEVPQFGRHRQPNVLEPLQPVEVTVEPREWLVTRLDLARQPLYRLHLIVRHDRRREQGKGVRHGLPPSLIW